MSTNTRDRAQAKAKANRMQHAHLVFGWGSVRDTCVADRPMFLGVVQKAVGIGRRKDRIMRVQRVFE